MLILWYNNIETKNNQTICIFYEKYSRWYTGESVIIFKGWEDQDVHEICSDDLGNILLLYITMSYTLIDQPYHCPS